MTQQSKDELWKQMQKLMTDLIDNGKIVVKCGTPESAMLIRVWKTLEKGE